MTSPIVTLGYVLLYVRDVGASLAFYETAFGLSRRFMHDDDGKAYGELETGTTRLGFVSLKQVATVFTEAPMTTAPDRPPLAVEIGLVTPEVDDLFARAVAAGAVPYLAPVSKPWGQRVAYVRDPDGHLVELCSPMP